MYLMRLTRSFGIFLGLILSAGCVVALITVEMTAGTAPAVPAIARSLSVAPPAALATAAAPVEATVPGKARATASTPSARPSASSGDLLDVGNPAGHAYVPPAGQVVDTSHPNHVIGNGSPVSCTSDAVVKAVAEGGIITFDCGPEPVTITMTATAKVVNTSHWVVLDGGGKVTLSGGGEIRILYMNTCDPAQIWLSPNCYEQEWPELVVQNMTFEDAYAAMQETATGEPWYGGGAIFDMGGQLKVVNSAFIDNKCYQYGPDLSGGAIRAYAMYQGTPDYIVNDTFRGNTCSNGAALGGLHANFDVINSLITDNEAIGWGQNPPLDGAPGGGSGGAIYTDGIHYNLLIDGTVIQDNSAREGGGAIFFAVVNSIGILTIEDSTLQHNPSGVFQNAPGIYEVVNGQSIQPVEIRSTVN